MNACVPQFSDELLLKICEVSDQIDCECPAYLVGLLREVRKFRNYTTNCKVQLPEEIATHEWLAEEALQVEFLLSKIVHEFMRRENLLNEADELDLDKLARRSYQAALRQEKL
jgi:hypothetical protein